MSQNNTILIDTFDSVLGPIMIGASDKGICLLEFSECKLIENEILDLQKRLKAKILKSKNRYILQAKEELKKYFDGNLKTFKVPLDLQGSDFQKSVWQILLNIPYGKTKSYKKQAELLGKPTAVRAVANANGRNKISIIIPCHRVIGSDGSLTGYASGLERKKFLLDLESKNI